MRRLLVLWFLLGSIYLAIEVLWRGYTHPSMLIVGGLCGVLVGAVNQYPRFYNMRVVWQSLFGAVIVLAVEFVSGCILNLWLGLEVWDYTGQFGNVLGQICIQYGVLWFALMPFAIWLEDTISWAIYDYARFFGRHAEKPPFPRYTLGSIYLELIEGR